MSIVPTAVHLASFECLQFGQTGSEHPAIVWLHGSGERGNDVFSVANVGLPAAVLAGRVKTNATVICPQLEANALWEPARVLRLLAAVHARHRCVALVGFSLGGQGVCDVVCHGGSVACLHVAVASRVRDLPQRDQTGVQFLALTGEFDRQPQMPDFVRLVNELGGTGEEHVIVGQGHFISESGLTSPCFQRFARAAGIELHLSSTLP